MMRLDKKRLHLIGSTALLLLFLTVLTACFRSDQESEKIKLRVLDLGSHLYESTYNIFEYEHPGIAVEVSREWPGNAAGTDLMYEQLLYESELPDVFVLNYIDFYELMNRQLLMPLDDYLSESNWDETKFVPGILDRLRSEDGGQLYGITANFDSRVLVYNKTLFDQANVPYPTEGITWDEVFEYARKLTQDDPDERIYGLDLLGNSPNPQQSDWLRLYAPSLGMKLFEDGEMTVDTTEWKQLWEMLIPMVEEGVFPYTGQYHHIDDDLHPLITHHLNLFLSGKVAMTTVTYSELLYINELDQTAHLLSDYEPVDWGIVSLPSHADNPGMVGGLELGSIMAIRAQSEYAQEAWQLIELLFHERYVSRDMTIPILQMDAEKLVISENSSENISVFYSNNFVLHPQYDRSFIWSFENIRRLLGEGDRQFDLVLRNEKKIEHALRDWQRGGNTLLR